MSLLVSLAQVKSQLDDAYVSTDQVTKFLGLILNDVDVYRFIAREMATSRSMAKALLLGCIHKHPNLEELTSPQDVQRFFELYPELRTWYLDDEDRFYLRYRE